MQRKTNELFDTGADADGVGESQRRTEICIVEAGAAFVRMAEEAFGLFAGRLAEWHRFQDSKGAESAGNCFVWWASRWGDWLTADGARLGLESGHDKIFPLVWALFEREFSRRSIALGITDRIRQTVRYTSYRNLLGRGVDRRLKEKKKRGD